MSHGFTVVKSAGGAEVWAPKHIPGFVCLDFPPRPKEEAPRLSYQLAQIGSEGEGRIVKLESCHQPNIKYGDRLYYANPCCILQKVDNEERSGQQR